MPNSLDTFFKRPSVYSYQPSLSTGSGSLAAKKTQKTVIKSVPYKKKKFVQALTLQKPNIYTNPLFCG